MDERVCRSEAGQLTVTERVAALVAVVSAVVDLVTDKVFGDAEGVETHELVAARGH